MHEMWTTHSINSVSARFKALYGKLRGAIDSNCDEDDSGAKHVLIAGDSLSAQEFEAVTVETEHSEPVKIFTSRTSEAAYFEESEEFEPTIVGTPAVDATEDSIVETRKKEKVNVKEAADLFINAYVRPVRKSFDATPVYKKKAAKVVPEAVVAEVVAVQPVESITINAPVAEVVVAEPAVPVAESVPVIEETVIEAPAVETVPEAVTIEAPAVEEIVIEAAPAEEAVPETVEAVTVSEPEIVASCEIPVVDEVVAAEPEAVELPAFDFAAIEAYSEPAPVAEAAAVPAVESNTVDSTVFENFESDESRVECEIAHAASENYEATVELEAPETIVAEAEPVSEEVAVPKSLSLAVIPVLPRKIEVPALEKDEQDAVSLVTTGSVEAVPTSAEAVAAPVTESVTLETVEDLKPVIKNEDRDLMFIFRPELEADENEFASTSFDDNFACREDVLDRTERVFKIRAPKIRDYRFNGNLRSLGCY